MRHTLASASNFSQFVYQDLVLSEPGVKVHHVITVGRFLVSFFDNYEKIFQNSDYCGKKIKKCYSRPGAALNMGRRKGRPEVLRFHAKKGGETMSKRQKKKKSEKRAQPLIRFFLKLRIFKLMLKLKITWPSWAKHQLSRAENPTKLNLGPR